MDKGFSNYEEFMEELNEDHEDRFELILDYEDFQVFQDALDGKYYYVECGENDADEFAELELVAVLRYDAAHDLLIKSGEELHGLFDCDMCGEHVGDDEILYMWFKERGHK